MHAIRREIVMEDGQNWAERLKVGRKPKTANREKRCVENEHWLAPGSSAVVVDVLPLDAFQHDEELAEDP
jgi:hypothetical protein